MTQVSASAPLFPVSGGEKRGHVVLVDDDQAVTQAFRAALEYEGYRCSVFGSAGELLADSAFLHSPPSVPTCILSDVMMPDMDGLALQRVLPNAGLIPLVFVSGASGAAEAAAGFRGGAMDFLVKPVELPVLVDAVGAALARSAAAIAQAAANESLVRRVALLTPREREVAKLAASGATNQETADALGIALRTAKYHRQQAMVKLEVESLAALVRTVDEGQL